MVEKILYEQPEVGRLYLLIQRKQDMSAADRLDELIDKCPLFDRLRGRYGEAYRSFMMSKLEAIEGNMMLPNLGISFAEQDQAEQDQERATTSTSTSTSTSTAPPLERAQRLMRGDASPANVPPSPTLSRLHRNVHVVINSAASTTFDERYDHAVQLNVLGALECAHFAANCEQLTSYVHISTAFVNGLRKGYTPEQPFAFNMDIASEMARKKNGKLHVEEEIALALTSPSSAIGMERARSFGWPDTYVFTKAMAEMLVERVVRRFHLPACIVRPSIVESTWREPLPGWMEGIRMADPIILGYGKGQLVGFAGDDEGVLDVVPCDVVINSCLAAMVQNARRRDANVSAQNENTADAALLPAPLPVYHVATSTANPLRNREFVRIVSEHFAANPMRDRTGQPIVTKPMAIFGSLHGFLFDAWQRYALPSLWGRISSFFLTMWQRFVFFVLGLIRSVSSFTSPSSSSSSSFATPTIPKRRESSAELVRRKTLEQLTYLAQIYTPYTFYKCRFGTQRTEELFAALSQEDQRRFCFDLRGFTWDAYLHQHITGLRMHVLKGGRG